MLLLGGTPVGRVKRVKQGSIESNFVHPPPSASMIGWHADVVQPCPEFQWKSGREHVPLIATNGCLVVGACSMSY